MTLPVDVTFRNMPSSHWLDALVRRRAAKLQTYCRSLFACHVLIERPHRHRESGNRFHVRVDLFVPGERIAVSRDANLHAALKELEAAQLVKSFDVQRTRKDILLTVRKAFDVARRRLRDHTDRLDARGHDGARRQAGRQTVAAT